MTCVALHGKYNNGNFNMQHLTRTVIMASIVLANSFFLTLIQTEYSKFVHRITLNVNLQILSHHFWHLWNLNPGLCACEPVSNFCPPHPSSQLLEFISFNSNDIREASYGKHWGKLACCQIWLLVKNKKNHIPGNVFLM